MCGIFFSYSKQIDKITKVAENYKEILAPLSRRGPDYIGTVHEPNFFAAHTLLSITGYKEQPCIVGDQFMLFNGEIYDDYANYDEKYGDTAYLEKFLATEGLDQFHRLDGEFAIVVYNQKSNVVSLVTDSFRTKPLFYQLTDDSFVISTYETVVKNCKFSGQMRTVPANVRIDIDLSTFSVVRYESLKKFDFCNANKTDYSGWNKAFRQALIKRASNTKYKVFVPMSAGHDSGILAAELADLEIPFHVYSVLTGENKEVLNARLERLAGKKGVDCEVVEMKEAECREMRDYLMRTMEPYYYISPLTSDKIFPEPDIRGNGGCIASSIICKTARERKQLIGLFGNGGDEIYADFYYGEKHNNGWSHVMGDWRSVAGAWPNFFGNWMTVFLGSSDLIGAHFSIEGRFPLLDTFAVQEFVRLTPELKSKHYKAPITNRFIELDFPYHNRKHGFAGADPVLYGRNG